MLSKEKKYAFDWLEANATSISDFHQLIWHYAEPALREYRSAKAYVGFLTRAGFEVQEGIGGMPTAFVATYGSGRPILGTYAEYDAVPGQSQKPTSHKEPIIPYGPAHTDPHSALGVASLAAIMASKEAMEKNRLKGTLRIFGTPAEKICVGKPFLAARGYLDNHDAFVCNHPWSSTTVHYETGLGAYWNAAFVFECSEPEKWAASENSDQEIYASHRDAKCPGALDALCHMYAMTRFSKESMLPFNGLWTLNEVVLIGGQSTSDNMPAELSVISYASRTPTVRDQERVFAVLEKNAKAAAEATGSSYKIRWVTKTRTGLPNIALANLAYKNLEITGPPKWSHKAKVLVRETLENADPQCKGVELFDEKLTPPSEFEKSLRKLLPGDQRNWLADDVTEFTWHAPTVWLHVARAPTTTPFKYPFWAWVATGGMREVIDPTIFTTAKAMSATILDLITQPEQLEQCQSEFRERTSVHREDPLIPRDLDPPIELRWPEYINTVRGDEWWIPNRKFNQL